MNPALGFKPTFDLDPVSSQEREIGRILKALCGEIHEGAETSGSVAMRCRCWSHCKVKTRVISLSAQPEEVGICRRFEECDLQPRLWHKYVDAVSV